MNKTITVSVVVAADINMVWRCWNEPSHIVQWAFASDDWEAPFAENDLREGGTFVTRMAAKDGSVSFDFNGVYTTVVDHRYIAYSIEGGRVVTITFEPTLQGVVITETFEMEDENSEELQRAGWQAILKNFKKYCESNL